MLIDSHVNLHAGAYAHDRAAVIARARSAGIGTMVTICCRLNEFAAALAVAEMDADIWCTVGVHPHHAADDPNLDARTLVALAAHPKVIAIGEAGLDYHYNYSPPDVQRRVLAVHAQAARDSGLPLVLHTREADDDMMAFLREEEAGKTFSFILHSYTSGRALAEYAVDCGGYFSVNGIASFRNATDVRGIIADIMPNDRVLLETDCPYLAPVPKRGRRNEPAYLRYINDCYGAIKGITPVETARQTTKNFHRLFTKVCEE